MTENAMTAYPVPTVEVLVVTYNHEAYIAQCLDSILMQRFEGSLAVTILEDFSTDATRDIIHDYARAHPQTIRLVLNPRNLNSNAAFMRELRSCRADFVTFIDGDDFWTEPDKLQRQLDFMVHNPDHALCFHDVWLVDSEGKRTGRRNPGRTEASRAELYERNYIATSSVLYRTSAVANLPDWMEHVPIALDWNISLFAALSGAIGLLPDPMAAYRVHPNGMWSRMNLLERALATLVETDLMFDRYPASDRPAITRGKRNGLEKLAHAYAAEHDLAEATRALVSARALGFDNAPQACILQAEVVALQQQCEVNGKIQHEIVLQCQGAHRLGFAVVNGVAVPFTFKGPHQVRLVPPTAVVASRSRLSVFLRDIRGDSNTVEILMTKPRGLPGRITEFLKVCLRWRWRP